MDGDTAPRGLLNRLLARRAERDRAERDRAAAAAPDNGLSEEAPRPFLRVAAPMVRYSKLPFRLLVNELGCDLAFTPMIVASTFNRSQRARDSDFSTAQPELGLDRPLVVQFAASEPVELAMAARKVQHVADAVDLNCGCPQRWAAQDGIGAVLSDRPQLVRDMVKECREMCRPDLEVSVKIRVHEDIRRTVDLVRQAEAAGVAWVSVHGRTRKERRQPVRYGAIRDVVQSATVPVIANGDALSADAVHEVADATGAAGVMCARGLLQNPAMFTGARHTPVSCATRYLELALQYGGHFTIHQHHLFYMLSGQLDRADRRELSRVRSMTAMVDYFEERGWWPVRPAS